MKRRRCTLVILLVSVCLTARGPQEVSPAWGFYGHRKINRQAVFSLPPEMMPFFKQHIDFLTEHAVDPDKRRYASPFEAIRHYIDLDVYGTMPFEQLPRNWTDALIRHAEIRFITEKRDSIPLILRDGDGAFLDFNGKISLDPRLISDSSRFVTKRDFRRFFSDQFLPQYYEDEWSASCDSLAVALHLASGKLPCQRIIVKDHLSEHGILPWHLQRMIRRLSRAFQEKDPKAILRLAADIGHYIADAHVPLHTTKNYNGQLTGQTGIHAFWESRLPELFADDSYDFWVGRAEFIEDPETYFWDIVFDSHALVDSVLLIEKELRESFPSDRQMCHDLRGETLVLTQCRDFAEAYHTRMSGMVSGRMRQAIRSVASAWYTAWVWAGQPAVQTSLEKDRFQLNNADTILSKRIQIRKHE